MATARAPMLVRISLAKLFGTMPLGAASSTSAAVCAAASRSLSQFKRKFATDGTYIKISATITNRMVSNSSLPERPTRHFRVGLVSALIGPVPFSVSKIASAEDSHPSDDAPHPSAGQTWSKKIDRRAFSKFRKRRIWKDKVG